MAIDLNSPNIIDGVSQGQNGVVSEVKNQLEGGSTFFSVLEGLEDVGFDDIDGNEETAESEGSGSSMLLEDFKQAVESCKAQEEVCAQDSLKMFQGHEVNIHQMMANLKKAELQTQLVTNVTGRLVNGVNELLKITV